MTLIGGISSTGISVVEGVVNVVVGCVVSVWVVLGLGGNVEVGGKLVDGGNCVLGVSVSVVVGAGGTEEGVVVTEVAVVVGVVAVVLVGRVVMVGAAVLDELVVVVVLDDGTSEVEVARLVVGCGWWCQL